MVELELDRTTYPTFRDAVIAAEASGDAAPQPPRSYPGYPRVELVRVRPRWWPSLDRILARRRSVRRLGARQPSRKQLSRLLQISHGITGPHWAGPVPSAGGLQALELYLVPLEPGWLGQGAYHYDRQGHCLARVVAEAPRPRWAELVPSLGLVEGGALLWVLVGDVGRVRRKYGERSRRFLLQESGHLMQTLCLASASLGLATVPMGGYLERAIARELVLPETDVVLYAGVAGGPE